MMTPEEARLEALGALDGVERAIVGKRRVLETVLIGLLARGHVLLEDVPGVAKTLIARCFAQVLGLDFKRIQFTPDLLPADVTGSYIYDQRRAAFEFRKGPVFTDLLLGDEINRAPPKTQAALLEAMQEGQVTVEDSTYPLGEPFNVIATQNPIEHEGTYPLPEAQLDRFILRTSIGYPGSGLETEMVERRLARRRDEIELEPVVEAARFIAMQEALETVHVDRSITEYVVAIVQATRDDRDVQVGASPRGTLALVKLARGRAMLSGRDFVTPEDVKEVAVVGLAHRITLRPELWVRRISGDDVVAAVLDRVSAPETRPAHDR